MTEEITNAEEAVEIVSDVLDLDVQKMKDDVDAVLGEELYWFPVRHHSPAVAKYLQQAIKTRKPKIIFIEGPFEATHLIPHLLDKRTKPPVAVYTSYRDSNNSLGLVDPFGSFVPGEDMPARFACWYPMMSYSPEYVAIETSHEVNAEVKFMDLPHYEIIGKNIRRSAARMREIIGDDFDDDDLSQDEIEAELADLENQGLRAAPTTGPKKKPAGPAPKGPGQTADTDDGSSGGGAGNGGGAGGDGGAGSGDGADNGEPRAPEDVTLDELLNYSPEELIVNSSFYQTLARVAGYHSWDECWDTIFEIHDYKDAEEFRKEFALFCRAVRSTTTDLEMQWDGTLDREKFMIKTINDTLAERGLEPKDAMVVCGGFHIFLDRDGKDEEPLSLEGTTYVTVVPYSYFRMSETSGYGAGNRAPRYYQIVWDSMKQKQKNASAFDTTLSEHIVDILKEARKLGEPLSSADAIAALQHAELLSRLRGRPQAILDDIQDAIISCCCKGNPEEDGIILFRAMNSAGIGTAIGKVTPDIGRLPIVDDFYKQLENLNLGELLEEKRVKLKLDKRQELDAERSAFFHRLKYLDVPAVTNTGIKTADFDTGKLFGEDWVMKWGPEIEAKLIEQNLFGDTIESAAIARLKVSLAAADKNAGVVCRKLLAAIEMDLPDLVQEAQEACGVAIDEDSRFISLCEALTSLLVLDKYADLRDLKRESLGDLIVKCFDRACFSILDVVSAPTEHQSGVVTALTTLAEAVLKGSDYGLDRDLFVEHVQYAYESCTVPFLRGTFFGILLEMRVKTSEELAQEIFGLTRSPADIMITAGDFLDGVMSVSRTSILIGADELIEALDELLKMAQWETFLSMLPRLRAAFDHLNEGQRTSLAEQVAKRYGLVEAASLQEFLTSGATAIELARIDALVADIMKEWVF